MELLDHLHDNLRLGTEEEAAKLHAPSTRRRTVHRRFNSNRRLQSKELSRCVEVLNSDKMSTQSTVYGLNGVSGALAWAHAASRSRGRACTAPAFNGQPCLGEHLETEQCDMNCPGGCFPP